LFLSVVLVFVVGGESGVICDVACVSRACVDESRRARVAAYLLSVVGFFILFNNVYVCVVLMVNVDKTNP